MVMTEHKRQVLVFKTTAYSEQDKYRIQEALLKLSGVSECSVDMEDVDRVLRVVTQDGKPEAIITTVKAAGIDCCELDG